MLTRCALAALWSQGGAAVQPHIVLLLIDDLGYGNVGWHRADLPEEVKTPTMDSLVAEGVELQRLYAFKYCSPTRSALQSGRNPIHVNVVNARSDIHNADDPVSGFAGIPLEMTGLASKMADAGYATHAVGKWDVGLASHGHTPQGKGYETWLGYFGHCNDYWGHIDKCGMTCDHGGTDVVDLWWQNGTESRPARNLHDKNAGCSQASQKGCTFEDELFKDHAIRVIEEHPLDSGKPLFLFWSTHGIHGPLEVPQATLDQFASIDHKTRRIYASLVHYVDGMVSDVVGVLRHRGMWENTLLLMSSDNGGDAAGNNWPLRGAKFSNWDGGIRVPGFISGGALPEKARGTRASGLAAVWDFHATIVDVAGGELYDARAAAAGLPPVDAVSHWSYWSGQTSEPPRVELAIGAVFGNSHGAGAHPQTSVEGLLQGSHKVLIGSFDEAVLTGPQFPNKSTHDSIWDTTVDCSTGCLYDLAADPSENVDLAGEKPELLQSMLARLREINGTVFSPYRGKKDPLGCSKALGDYGGYWGPFLDNEAAALV